jgi:hypothetical protein
VTFNSAAARVKLRCRAAASKARNPFSEGSLAAIRGAFPCMTLFHPKRYEVSFVKAAEAVDISRNDLAAGGFHVRLRPPINDK